MPLSKKFNRLPALHRVVHCVRPETMPINHFVGRRIKAISGLEFLVLMQKFIQALLAKQGIYERMHRRQQLESEIASMDGDDDA